jgi:hypothetical protein
MQKPTKEQLQKLFNYIDGNLHHKNKRRGVRVGTRAGTVDKDGYIVIHLNQKKYKAHHLVWIYHYDVFPKMIDHIDNDRKNNNIHNLRIATNSQNQMNRKLNKNNKSGIKGLRFRKNRWLAQIRFNNVNIHKSFMSKEDAIQFLFNNRPKLHGDFARFQ